MTKKIPLEVYNFAGSLRIMAHFLVRAKDPHLFLPIKGIVDTGSPISLIGPIDLKKMRVSRLQLNKKLEGRIEDINIGGGQISTRILNNATLRFGDGSEFNIPLDFVVSHKDNPSQPSLLGMNFLVETKAKLVFDPINRTAYLEINE